MINKLVKATASGVTITLALFYVMTLLIDMQPGAYADAPRLPPITLARVTPDSPIQPIEEDHTIPDPVTPPPIRPPAGDDESGPTIPVSPPPTLPPAIDRTGPGVVMNDGPLVAIVRVAPEYPQQPLRRNLEGYVIVEFDVLADGSVANVRVFESSSSLFERAAINAAKRFRYKASIVDGIAQVSTGIRSKISFRLDDAT